MGTYSVGLVGESRYQPAVRQLESGMVVELKHEAGNRHDDRAVVAIGPFGDVVGYVERGSWLQRIVADEGGDVFAQVLKIVGEGKKSRGVVLEVHTAKEAKAKRDAYAAFLASRRGCLW